jgi:hypothetical protein
MKREDYYLADREIQLLTELNKYIVLNNCRQIDLLNVDKFSKLTNDNETSTFRKEYIQQLWKLGFINADLVKSTSPLEEEGLIPIKEEDAIFYYSDIRKLEQRDDGYQDILDIGDDFPDDIELFFHPYRCFVLYHINQTLKLGVGTMQYLYRTDGFKIINDKQIEALNNWLANEDAMKLFFYWNYITYIAILLEPPAYQVLYSSIIVRHNDLDNSPEKVKNLLVLLYQQSENILKVIGQEKLEYYRNEICFEADNVDGNRELHLLIRLMDKEKRKYIKGKIAGTILFKEMVEVYRRHIEEVFKTKIPEEDECGHADVNTEYKLKSQGSYRLFDGERIVVNQFLRTLGLDYGIRVNVYVEGDTEYHALNAKFETDSFVNIINLKGAFSESKGKGVAFRESLRNDLKSKIFSIVVFDEDVSDNVRAMKKAVEEKELVGRFFISKPDFEFENFSLEELCDVAILLAQQHDISIDEAEIFSIISETKTGKEFEKSISQYSVDLGRLIKGQAWGKALTQYVDENHEKFQDKTIMAIFNMISQCKYYSYELSKTAKINPETGEVTCK